MESKLGHCIKNRREELNLSVKEVAERANISHTELYRLEKGERTNPSMNTFRDIAKALELTFEELAIEAGYIDDSTLSYSERIKSLSNSFIKMVAVSKYFIQTIINTKPTKLQLDKAADYLIQLNKSKNEFRNDLLKPILSDLALDGWTVSISKDWDNLGDIVAEKPDERWLFEILYLKDKYLAGDESQARLDSILNNILGKLASHQLSLTRFTILTNSETFYKECKNRRIGGLSVNVSVAKINLKTMEWKDTLVSIGQHATKTS